MSQPNDLTFRDAWEARDSITKKQEREIRKLYNEWARQVREQADTLSKIGTPESANQARELAQLYYQLRSASKQLTTEINTSIENNVEWMANQVANVNKRWLMSLGFTSMSIDKKFSLAKDMAIRNIITGGVYNKGYTLSQRLWDIENYTMKDIYSIVAQGIAKNMSINDIAKLLQKYLRPDSASPSGVHNRQVDYRARRLARTLIQHAYQQVLVALTKDNPFVQGYMWHADGYHACELCESRDGRVFSAEELPLDHPNGMCSMEPIIDKYEMVKVLSDLMADGQIPDGFESFFQGLDFRPDFD